MYIVSLTYLSIGGLRCRIFLHLFNVVVPLHLRVKRSDGYGVSRASKQETQQRSDAPSLSWGKPPEQEQIHTWNWVSRQKWQRRLCQPTGPGSSTPIPHFCTVFFTDPYHAHSGEHSGPWETFQHNVLLVSRCSSCIIDVYRYPRKITVLANRVHMVIDWITENIINLN